MVKKGQKLLFVANDGGFFLSHRQGLALAAQAKGMVVHVAAPSSNADQAIQALGFAFHPLSLSRQGVNPLAELAALWRIWRLFWHVRPHLVHNVTIKPVIYGGLAARLAAVPALVQAVTGLGYVFIGGGFKKRLLRGLVRPLYRLALGHHNGTVIFQNPDDLAEFVKARLVNPASAVLIRGSGVDTRLFAVTPEPDGQPVVMLASRLLWDKGVGEFVRAARQLKEWGINGRFVLVGEPDPGNPASVPLEQLEDWAAEGWVEWWGRKRDMAQVLAQATLVCLPSYREGLPRVLIEAACCGRAMVATDVPGCREIVQPGVTGLLAPPRESEPLAEAIRDLLEDAPRRRRMAQEARRLAETEYSVERVAEQTLKLYASLLA